MFVYSENGEKFERHPYKGDMDRLFSFTSPSDVKFELDGAEIVFDVYKDDTPDNVICEGQVVQVESGKYKKMIVSGFAMLGCFEDTVKLEYDDGSVENKAIFMYCLLDVDYYYSNLFNNFSSNNCKQLCMYKNKLDKKFYIWSCVIEIDKDKKLQFITLPNNELMQVFNISLLK